MGFFKDLTKRLAAIASPRVPAVEKAVGNDAFGSALVGTFGGSIETGRLSEDQDPAEQMKHFKHWIYAAINARATAVAQAKLRIYIEMPNGERKEITERESGAGKLVKLLQRPNLHQTWYQFLYKNQAYLDLTGDCYMLMDQNTLLRPTALWTLDPSAVAIHASREGNLTYVVDPNSADEAKYEMGEVVHGLYPDPQSQFYGVSPLQAATEAVNIHRSIHKAQDMAFQQGLHPGLIIQANKPLKEDQIKRLKTRLDAGYKASDRAGKSLLLEDGLTALPWSLSPREMNFLVSNEMNRDEILAIYMTSAAILGLSKDVNRASAEALQWAFATWTVTPLLTQWADLLTWGVCKKFDPRLVCEFDSVVPKDMDAETKRMADSVKGSLITPNEGRAVLGFEPRAEGGADKLYINQSMLPVGDGSQPKDDDDKKKKKGDAKKALPAPAPQTQKQGEPGDAGDGENPFFPPDDWVGGAVAWNEEAERFAAGSEAYYKKIFQNGWDLELAAVGVQDIPAYFDANIAEYMRGKQFEYFDFLLESTRGELGNALAQGLENGETFKQMRARVQDVYVASEIRAERIARTEAGNAQDTAAQSSRRAFGVAFKEWVAVFVNTRPTHSKADGQIVATDSMFIVGDVNMSHPHASGAPASEVVNCQCRAVGNTTGKALDETIRKAYAYKARQIQVSGEKEFLKKLQLMFRQQGKAVLASWDKLGGLKP